jgi:hypothetical protein
LPVILYGRETWSLVVKEKHRLRVSETRVLENIVGPKRCEVTGDWRRLHKEKLHDLCSSPNIFWVTKSRRETGGRGEVHTGFCWENLRERNHLKDLSIDGRIILKGIFKQ